MNHMKQALHDAFDAPPPTGKRDFFRENAVPSPSIAGILCTQILYIRKWVWLASVGILATALAASVLLPEHMVQIVSAATPLLSLILVTECGRSEWYGMAELELSTRLSLKTVLLARLAILGGCSALLIGPLLPLMHLTGIPVTATTVLHIITPFLLNTFTDLLIVRIARGREGMFGCAAVTAVIICLLTISHHLHPILFDASLSQYWVWIALLLGVGILWQIHALMILKEEPKWNWS